MKFVVNPFESEAQRAWMHINKPEMAKEWEAHTPKGKKLPKRKKKPTVNSVLRRDPTRTLTLRRAFCMALRKRFARLRGLIYKLIAQENALGITANFNPDQARDNYGRFTSDGGEQEEHAPGSHVGHPGHMIEEVGHLFHEHLTSGAGGAAMSLGSVIAAMKLVGGKFGASVAHAEHVAKDYVKDGVALAIAKLPEPLQKLANGAFAMGRMGTAAAFTSYTAGQKIAEKIAVERGYTPEQARRLRGILATADVALAKPAALTLGPAASFVPHATMGYLAYSTARDPAATARVAAKSIRGAGEAVFKDFSKRPGTFKPEIEVLNASDADKIATALENHDFDDTFIAYLCAAMDLYKDVGLAIDAASDDYVENVRWQFNTSKEQVDKFLEWLAEQNKEIDENDLWRHYIQQGFARGAGRSFDDVRGKKPRFGPGQGDFYAGNKSEFLRSVFNQPETVEKVQLLVGRTYTDLVGVTDTMSAQMARELADGLTEGKNPREIADDLTDKVNVAEARAETIARTEIIRAHAEGQLTAMENLGVEEVGVAVEWSTTGDDKVCEECAPLEGVVLKIDEARNMLPRHPNCRCAWIPANVGEDDKDQKADAAGIRAAIRESVGGDEDETWAGADKSISKDRPESVLNTFCATGPGGGVDPSCGAGASSGAKKGGGPKFEARLKSAIEKHIGKDEAKAFDGLIKERHKIWKQVKKEGLLGTSEGEARLKDVKERIAKVKESALSVPAVKAELTKPVETKPVETKPVKTVETKSISDFKVDHENYINSTLTDWHREAIKSYTGHSYSSLNAKMRSCPPTFSCLDKDKSKKMMAEYIMEAVDNAPKLKEPITVHRGIRGLSANQFLSKIKVGNAFQWPSFASTSTSTSVSEDFSSKLKNNGVMFRIKTRSGLYVEKISKAPEEKEMIISPHTKFMVTKKEGNVVHLEEVS